MGEFIRDRLPDPVTYFEGEGLPLAGRGKWRTTRCEFHGGSDSLRVNVESGGWVCMSCFTRGGDVLAHQMQAHQLDFVTAARALGAYIDDGAPHRGPTAPRPLSYRDALEMLQEDALVTWLVAADESAGRPITDANRAARLAAVRRIHGIVSGVLR